MWVSSCNHVRGKRGRGWYIAKGWRAWQGIQSCTSSGSIMATASQLSVTSLENAAEAAYLTATSPSAATASPTSDQEFEFSVCECQLGSPQIETVPHYIVTTENGSVSKASEHTDLPERVGSRQGQDQALKSREKGAFQKKADVVPLEVEDSPSAASRPSDSKILVIYGPTGNGKTHLVEKLVHKNPGVFSLVVSHTTRKRREGELSGITFHFIRQREMSREIARGNFIEYVHLSKPTGQASGRRGSAFDLTAEDSPAVGGETFGTSWQALHDARQQGKPFIILNVSSKGAKQLKEAGIDGSYILLQPHPSSEHLQEDIQPDFMVSVSSMDQAYTELQQHASKIIENIDLPIATKRQIVQEEWDSRPTVVIRRSSRAPTNLSQREVSFIELLSHCQSSSRQLATARAEQRKGGLARLFSRNKLTKRLQSERNLVLTIATTPLDTQEALHLQTLQTIYQKLTGNSINCGRIGRHWEEIGFQGVDPADDLRGVGFFGLMQLVYFLESSTTLSLAREIYTYSKDEANEGHFAPFCVLSLNMTQVALRALQDGALSKFCNKQDQVVAVVNDFYVAVFYHYYQLWKTQKKTIHDLGLLVQEVGSYACQHVKTLLRDMERYFAGKERESRSVVPTQGDSSENPFTHIEDMQNFTATVVLDQPE